ncbi:hypothetical protein HOE31_02590, partial [bacterium]|nr:hypothetical protein [bacterium]
MNNHRLYQLSHCTYRCSYHLVWIPKYSISYVVCLIKSKSSAWIKKKTKKIPKGSFWARGYFVTTVGVDEEIVRQYVMNQQHHQVELPKLPFTFR